MFCFCVPDEVSATQRSWRVSGSERTIESVEREMSSRYVKKRL